MGVCSSCLKQQPDQESEAAPLLAHQEANNKEIVQNPTEEVPEEGTINFHKSIIDDANGKFISSSSFKNHSRNQINAEEARIKLSECKVDPKLISSTPGSQKFTGTDSYFSQTPPLGEISIGGVEDSGDSSVLAILSESVIVSERLDVGADEIAEIVSSHMFSDRHRNVGPEAHTTEDGDNNIYQDGVVSRLKPVVVSSSGNN